MTAYTNLSADTSARRDDFARAGRSRSKTPRHVAIRVIHHFNASQKRVFDAWLDPEMAGDWLFATASHPMTHVAIDARVGGSFHFADRRNGVQHTGEYVEILPHRRLSFTLFLEDRSRTVTRVNVDIVPLKKGCKLTLRHENLPPACAHYAETRWTGVLYGLGVTL